MSVYIDTESSLQISVISRWSVREGRVRGNSETCEDHSHSWAEAKLDRWGWIRESKENPSRMPVASQPRDVCKEPHLSPRSPSKHFQAQVLAQPLPQIFISLMNLRPSLPLKQPSQDETLRSSLKMSKLNVMHSIDFSPFQTVAKPLWACKWAHLFVSHRELNSTLPTCSSVVCLNH